jgi:hypothetical protein
MPEPSPYFQTLQLGDRVELRPSPQLVRSKIPSAGCFFLLGVLPVLIFYWFGDQPFREVLIWIACMTLFCFLLWLANLRRRRKADIPLILGPGPRVMHGETILSARSEFSAVQVEAQRNVDDPDSYYVLLLPVSGEPVSLPPPYFGDLDFDEAVLLANEVAKLLNVSLKRELKTEAIKD